MDRTTYQYTVLGVLAAIVIGLALYRYHTTRAHFTPYLFVPLTGDVQVVDLETGTDPRIDLNNASLAQLDALPGVSSAIASRIIALRPMHDLAELAQIRGIGEKRLSALAQLAYCGPFTSTTARLDE